VYPHLYATFLSFSLQVDEKDAQYQQVKTENEQRAAAVDQLRHDLAAAQATCAELQQQLKDAGQASSQQMKERSLRIDNLERELQSANVCACAYE
jgi:uncharacterized protein YlxW (UPF0749 family)